ncbi:MAG: SPFH domain-containing protein [Gammaproteobacteria bacterium]
MLTTTKMEKKRENQSEGVPGDFLPSAPLESPDPSFSLVTGGEFVQKNSREENAKPKVECKAGDLSTVDESIVLDASSHTLDLPQVDLVRPSASVPGSDKDPETDPVIELKPDYMTFSDIKAGDFVKSPDTELNFIDWAEQGEADWIRKANATTREELLRVVNGKNHGNRDSTSRSIKLALATVATAGAYTLGRSEVLMPGQIYFTMNLGTQEIILINGNESQRETILTPTKKWTGSVPETVLYHRVGNITIANIQPGHVGFAIENQRPVILLPGRHAFNNPNFILKQEDIVDIRKPDFRKPFTNNLAIIRIQPTEIGIAEINGSPMILLPGLHIKRDANFKFIEVLNTRDLQSVESRLEHKREQKGSNRQAHHYAHGPLTLVQVNRDKLGFAITKDGPVVLNPGVYLRKDPSFIFGKFEDANAQYKEFYSIHLINVRPNQVALVWLNNQAHVLWVGKHQFNTRSFIFDGQFKNLYEQDEKAGPLLLRHGNYTIFRIGPDEYGYGFEVKSGAPKRLKPGFYPMNSLEFIFEKRENVAKTHEYKGIHHVVVAPGMSRVVTFADGTQKILKKGTHNFTGPNAILSDPVDMKETVLVLHEKKVTLADKSILFVTGQVSYQTVNPIDLVNHIGQDKLKEYLDLNIESDLREAFLMKDSSMLSSGKSLFERKEVEGDQLRGDVCTEIKNKLTKEVEPWGVKIVDVRISDMHLEDQAVLAQATTKARTAQADLLIQQATNATDQEKEIGKIQRTLKVEQLNAEITAVKTKAEIEKNTQQAKQQAEADALKITKAAEAKAAAIKSEIDAQVEAESNKIMALAQANANAKGLIAKADAEAKLTTSDAEAKSIFLIGKARADVIKAKAEALKEKNQATLQVPEYLRLQEAKMEVQKEEARAKRQTPAVIMGGGMEKTGMFFGEGMQLIKHGIKQHGQFARRNSTPSLLQDEKTQAVVVKKA